jgi:hypothetical protein
MRCPASNETSVSVAYFSSFPIGFTITFRSFDLSAPLFCITMSSPAGRAFESVTAKGCFCAHFARFASSPADAPHPGKKPSNEDAIIAITRITAKTIRYSVVVEPFIT